ncbi:ABC transporter ATP-binding protein [Ruegeria jejuensis]|uniref:ABC transporter ATP-binding protein n=1 Tax=Ruegeria jejuensis TaxID=3233338 RepID=UPI00355B595D
MTTVSVRKLVKVYGQEIAVRGIDLDFEDRAFTVLVGPSGCGKSTTLRMIAGLETISHGDLLIDDVVSNDLPSRARGVAMVFQSYALYPHMSVRQNLEFSLKLEKLSTSEIEQRVNDAIAVLELGPYLDRKPSELSGGQRQRVAIGRALVREPRVFLFDEPLSNLDAKLRNQMRIEIKRIQKQLDVTAIYVTHDQVEAMTLADVIVVMRDGMIEQTGRPIEVFHNPANMFVAGFIGSPQMNFFPGHIEHGDSGPCFVINDTALPLPADRFGPLADGQDVTAGFRPEDIVVNPDPSAPTITATVDFSELLGNETLLYAQWVDRDFICRMYDPDVPEIGQAIRFGFQPERMHLFNSETGASLRKDQ